MNRSPRLRFLIAMAPIATAVVVLLGVAAHCPRFRSESLAYQRPQLVLGSLFGQQTLNIDRTHLPNGSSSACPRKAHAIAAALPPSSSTVLAALGVVVALLSLAGPLTQRVAPTGRGPPRGLPTPLTGQDVLTRFCLARR
jgi:hypothetical protein